MVRTDEKIYTCRKTIGGPRLGRSAWQLPEKDGYLENDEYIVSWAIGHLVGLAEPEDYDVQLKNGPWMRCQ